jgi:TDG/mug DNA glycosylase family protein
MLEDILSTNLDIVFCGINPGLTAAATGHHFAGRGNRFWKVLHLSGFTDKELSPSQDRDILEMGYGLTSVVRTPTAKASEISRQELHHSCREFEQKIIRFAPRYAAFLGKVAFSTMFDLRVVPWGAQTQTIGETRLWVLPNPSGLNRGFKLDDLVTTYRKLYVER